MTTLTEVAKAPVKKGNRWRVKIATPGQGSSGFYTADVLREYGPVAIPAGTKSFLGHAKPEDRSLRDLVGSFPDGAYWSAEENALFADLEPATSKWADVLNELGTLAEASISVAGTKDAQGNVLTLAHSRANSVDLVAHAGLEGSGLTEQIESLIESARSVDPITEPGVTPGAGDKEHNMDKIEEQLTKLTSVVESLVADKSAKATADAQAAVDAAAISTAVNEALATYDAKIALIEAETELLPSQRAFLREQAKAGADVAPLIESAKKVVAEATQALTESAVGRGFTSADKEDWTVAGVRF